MGDAVPFDPQSLSDKHACYRAVQSVVTCHYGPSWDTGDDDFSSGGVSVVPQQPGPTPILLTAAGKFDARYLLTAQAPGEFTPKGPNNDGAAQAIDSPHQQGPISREPDLKRFQIETILI
jgi:hypothetical protein